ncbi:MAG: hypothetical protein IK093_12795 [Ruminiclostridium sp.]|nr:hypothetical protein [Ruminiclostridium sp.]
MNNKKNFHPDLRFLITALIAFAFTGIIAIVRAWDESEGWGYATTALAVTVFLFSLLAPAFARFEAYSELYRGRARTGNFSASFAINEYHLTGWITGKYMFLDAVSSACEGNFERAFTLYCGCLDKAEDKRLRLACYKDMVKNLKRMNEPIRLIPVIRRGCDEFPDETVLFEYVAGYYMWFRYADEQEALEWFRSVSTKTSDNTVKMRSHFFMGLSKLYKGEYEQAETELEQAWELCYPRACYLAVDIAMCKACLGKFDEAREYASQSVILADDQSDVDYISEKLCYLFGIRTDKPTGEAAKLVEELKRRKNGDAERAVSVSDIERFTEAAEIAKKG